VDATMRDQQITCSLSIPTWFSPPLWGTFLSYNMDQMAFYFRSPSWDTSSMTTTSHNGSITTYYATQTVPCGGMAAVNLTLSPSPYVALSFHSACSQYLFLPTGERFVDQVCGQYSDAYSLYNDAAAIDFGAPQTIEVHSYRQATQFVNISCTRDLLTCIIVLRAWTITRVIVYLASTFSNDYSLNIALSTWTRDGSLWICQGTRSGMARSGVTYVLSSVFVMESSYADDLSFDLSGPALVNVGAQSFTAAAVNISCSQAGVVAPLTCTIFNAAALDVTQITATLYYVSNSSSDNQLAFSFPQASWRRKGALWVGSATPYGSVQFGVVYTPRRYTPAWYPDSSIVRIFDEQGMVIFLDFNSGADMDLHDFIVPANISCSPTDVDATMRDQQITCSLSIPTWFSPPLWGTFL
jgi:hypothetical protein